MLCTLTLLAMFNWKHIEKTEPNKKAFTVFKTRLDKVMVSGYYEFDNRADEEEFLATAAGFLHLDLKKLHQF